MPLKGCGGRFPRPPQLSPFLGIPKPPRLASPYRPREGAGAAVSVAWPPAGPAAPRAPAPRLPPLRPPRSPPRRPLRSPPPGRAPPPLCTWPRPAPIGGAFGWELNLIQTNATTARNTTMTTIATTGDTLFCITFPPWVSKALALARAVPTVRFRFPGLSARGGLALVAVYYHMLAGLPISGAAGPGLPRQLGRSSRQPSLTVQPGGVRSSES